MLGEDHPVTLGCAHNLSAELRVLGHYEQARALDEDTLTRRRRTSGDDHSHTLEAATALAGDLSALQQQRAAELEQDTQARRQRNPSKNGST